MSYESLTLADLKELATTIHIKEYGTKADIIGRIKAHPVGTSLLNKLETSKKKEKEEQKDNGKLFEIKDKLTPQFCSEFNLKFLGESTKGGPTMYNYVEKKGKEGSKKKSLGGGRGDGGG